LVRVARMTAKAPQSPLAMLLLGDADGLSARVDRLLRAAPPLRRPVLRPTLGLSAIVLVAAYLALAILHPVALYSVHMALEHLVE
jgi:hypothetical protein